LHISGYSKTFPASFLGNEAQNPQARALKPRKICGQIVVGEGGTKQRSLNWALLSNLWVQYFVKIEHWRSTVFPSVFVASPELAGLLTAMHKNV
jgi:hypothetical protein